MCQGTVWPAECNLPEHGSVVNGALFFKRLPTQRAIVDAFTTAFSTQLRFRSLAKSDGTWAPASVDPSYHFVESPPAAGSVGVRATIEELIMEDLDHSHPLWRVHRVPAKAEGELSAVLLRVHHCIGDGFAIVSIFQGMARQADGTPAGETALMRRLAEERARRQQGCAVKQALRGVAIGADAVKSFISNVSLPFRCLETDLSITKPREERKRACQYGARRRVVYVPPHSLAYVKACKDAARKTVNDIVLSATSGALRRYCEQRGDAAIAGEGRIRARALLPVANPDPGSENTEDGMANNFAFVSCRLALSEAEPLERLHRTSANMMRIKHSTKAMVSLWQTNTLSKAFSEKTRQNLARDLFANHSLVFSNLPGPEAPIYIAGEPLEEVQAIYPNLISQVIVLSYNGRINMNFTVDPDLIEDADALASCYLAELRDMGTALGVIGDPLACGPRPAATIEASPTMLAALAATAAEKAAPATVGPGAQADAAAGTC